MHLRRTIMKSTAIFILSLALGVLAVDVSERTEEQVIRVGSATSGFAPVKGYLIPKGGSSSGGIPTYEFRSTINGVPVKEKDFVECRCEILYSYDSSKLRSTTTKKPVLFCNGSGTNKGGPASSSDKMAFLFAADSLSLDPKVKVIKLLLGKTTWRNIVAIHASAATAAPGRS